MKIAGYKKHSFVDGPGVRFVLFAQGCPHHCPGCHNPDTHDLEGGLEVEEQHVTDMILHTEFIDGVTLSGGDPFLQPEAVGKIAQKLKEKGINIWAYTGWRFEELLKDSRRRAVLNYIDVLVDGPFVISQKSSDYTYRGSSNQRLIDVQASLKNKEARIWQN